MAPYQQNDVDDDLSPTVRPPASPKLESINLVRLVLGGWWIVLIVLTATVAAAAFTTAQRERVYRSSSTLAVVPSDTVLGSREATINSINVLDRRTIPNTFAEIARSRSVLQTAAEKVGFTEADLEAVRSSAVVLPETFVVRITVDADDPTKAAMLANGVLEETSFYALSSYPAYQARQLDRALPMATPASPQPVRDIGAAAIVGIVLGCVVAGGVQYLRVAGAQQTSHADRHRGALRHAETH